MDADLIAASFALREMPHDAIAELGAGSRLCQYCRGNGAADLLLAGTTSCACLVCVGDGLEMGRPGFSSGTCPEITSFVAYAYEGRQLKTTWLNFELCAGSLVCSAIVARVSGCRSATCVNFF